MLGGNDLFKRANLLRRVAAKAFAVAVGDELSQRSLPGFLTLIGEAGELLGVHAEFTSLLYFGMGQLETLPGLEPWLELLGNPLHLEEVAMRVGGQRLSSTACGGHRNGEQGNGKVLGDVEG
jgi:hypothetical protein